MFTGGYLVQGFNEETLVSTLNVTDTLHKQVLLQNLNQVKENGVKLPSNLWEFKVIYELYIFDKTVMV